MKITHLDKIHEHDVIAQAVRVLRHGGLVIYPTETVYGAGVDATNPAAVKKLGEYKSRPFGKPFSIAVADQKMAAEYVELNDTAKNLYRQFLPGALTVISKVMTQGLTFAGRRLDLKGADMAPGIVSETGTLGIRISSHPLVTAIVKKLGRPITATSANQAWGKRPYLISDILFNISDKKKQLIDLIIDAGKLPKNEPSTVIDTTLDDRIVLRQGDIKLKDKNQILSRSAENTQNFAKELWQKYEQFAGKRAIVFALEGPLGVGKTEFTKGLARAMGIKKEITSPTFQIINIYKSSAINPAKRDLAPPDNQQLTISNLTHIDAWRLESSSELESLDFAETISDKSVIAVEWADRVADTIKKFNQEAIIIWIKIVYGEGENERTIEWGAV